MVFGRNYDFTFECYWPAWSLCYRDRDQSAESKTLFDAHVSTINFENPCSRSVHGWPEMRNIHFLLLLCLCIREILLGNCVMKSLNISLISKNLLCARFNQFYLTPCKWFQKSGRWPLVLRRNESCKRTFVAYRLFSFSGGITWFLLWNLRRDLYFSRRKISLLVQHWLVASLGVRSSAVGYVAD